MSCTDRCTTIEQLALKKSPYLDSLRSAIPKLPVKMVNESTLPKWKKLPLESKIPSVGAPLLARRKLGEALRFDCPKFDTSDPYNYEVRLEYEGLHDPHLARFFQATDHLRESIIKSGLVSPRLDVMCTLKDYNAYRFYLRSMQAKLMRLELEKRDEMQKEKYIMDIAEKQTVKANEKLKKDEIRNAVLNELRLKEDIRLRRIKEKLKDVDDRCESLIQTRWQKNQAKKLESSLKREMYGRKLAAMAKKEQQIILNTSKKLHDRDRMLKKTLEANSTMRQQMKLNEAFNRFERKKISQEEWIEKEKYLKDCAEKLKERFRETYGKKLERDRIKMQELLEEKKKKRGWKIKRRVKKRKLGNCQCQVQ